MNIKYKAFVASETDRVFSQKIQELNTDNLPSGEVLIRVKYAGLNYKDALSSFGHKGITRNYPHTPGVDAAGYVVEDSSKTFAKDTPVICTSFDLGMNTSGSFGEYIRVPKHWVIPLPDGISPEESMILGTAAYTAGLAIYKMEKIGQNPEMGKVCVTGATGGVGSMAIALLHHIGYSVIASTGKTASHDYLKSIGASEIIDRREIVDTSNKPLLSPKWAGAIDNVGGETLSSLLKSCGRNGSVASIGLVDSPNFQTSVFPFILNGVNLLGIDSAETPLDLRHKIWNKLSKEWRISDLEKMSTIIGLTDLVGYLNKMKSGSSVGRIVLKHF